MLRRFVHDTHMSSTPSAAIRHIGVPKEIKGDERRVALTPDGAAELVQLGCEVVIEHLAGHGSGFPDEEYVAAGATIVQTADEAWAADLVVKVKEPQTSEFPFLRADLTLFTYLHLAAYPKVAQALIEAGTTAFAYETVTDKNGGLPLLAPMSEIAGKLATQMGAHHLSAHLGGSGVLLGGAPGVAPASVVVIGGGNVGWASATMALGLGAQVTVIDSSLDRLRWIDEHSFGRLIHLASNRSTIARSVEAADLVIGAVLVAGDKAPIVVTEQMITAMRPGSVVVDVAIDQGGCIETSVETTHANPTKELHGVIHYAVGNMPGAVPQTSTKALTNATLPRIVQLATFGRSIVDRDPHMAEGLNVSDGKIVNQTVALSLA